MLRTRGWLAFINQTRSFLRSLPKLWRGSDKLSIPAARGVCDSAAGFFFPAADNIHDWLRIDMDRARLSCALYAIRIMARWQIAWRATLITTQPAFNEETPLWLARQARPSLFARWRHLLALIFPLNKETGFGRAADAQWMDWCRDEQWNHAHSLTERTSLPPSHSRCQPNRSGLFDLRGKLPLV